MLPGPDTAFDDRVPGGPAPPAGGARRGRRALWRPYLALVTGLLSVGGTAMAAAVGLGFSESSALSYFLAAAVLGALGVAAWAAVVFTPGREGRAPLLAWVAFPVALFSLVGMLPLLLVAIFPEALDFLGGPDRLEVRRGGERLWIGFPRRMQGEAINLELDGTPVPPDYFRAHPQRAAWEHSGGIRPRSFLVLDLEGIRSDLGAGPVRRLGLNEVLTAPQILDESGKRFQPQKVDVPGAEAPR